MRWVVVIIMVVLYLHLFVEYRQVRDELTSMQEGQQPLLADLNVCACSFRELARLYGVCDAQLDPKVRYSSQAVRAAPAVEHAIDCSGVSIYE